MMLLSDEQINNALQRLQKYASEWDDADFHTFARAIEAAVLEELAGQEPVACMDAQGKPHSKFKYKRGDCWLYAAPVVQEKQEPVAWVYYPKGVGEKYVTYTNPASLDLGKQGDQIAFIQPLYAAPVVQPDMVRLYDDITEVVAKQLHYFDNVEKINGATTAKEVFDVLEGGIDRYRNDTVFHAKVCSLVAHLKQVIAAAEKEQK